MPERKIGANEDALANMLSLVLRLANKLSQADAFARNGLTLPEWTLLNEIPADGSEITLRKLSALLGLSPQRVKVLVAKLESSGAVQESLSAQARTAKSYVITATGASLRSAAEKAISDMQISTLSPSQSRGLARSARIVRRLSKMVDRGQPAA